MKGHLFAAMWCWREAALPQGPTWSRWRDISAPDFWVYEQVKQFKRCPQVHADARFVGGGGVWGGPPWERCCRPDSLCTFSAATQKDSCTVWIELKLFLRVLQKIPHEVCVLFAPLLSACVLTNSLVSCFSSDDIIGVPATCLSCWRKSFPMTPIVPSRCYLTRLL